MAYEGELVKLENGRWARFQRCLVQGAAVEAAEHTSILVAVELDDAQQSLLRAAEDSFEIYWRLGARPGVGNRHPLTTDEEHPQPSWPGDLGALH
jgi:hypothetical protein